VPVICCANDAFAPCLRPLKEVAAVYYFKPPAPARLATRLADIAAAERLTLDRNVRRPAHYGAPLACLRDRQAGC
jgi:DNA polymerase III delta prime subunit